MDGMGWDGLDGLDGIRVVVGIEHLTVLINSVYSHPPNAGICLIYLGSGLSWFLSLPGYLYPVYLPPEWYFKPVVRWAPAMAMRDYSPPGQVLYSNQ